jgi:hypothetical protein
MLPYGESFDADASRWKMLHVSKVPSGLKCECRCPSCKAPLIARHAKGSTRASHFAHRGNSGCRHAFETMLHKVAKQIIADNGWIMLPPATLRDREPPVELKPASKFIAGSVELEKMKGDIKPDVVMEKRAQGKTHELLVEIQVHHKCEPKKLAYIRENELASVEIDLSGIKEIRSEQEIIRQVLMGAPREWLFNRHIAAAEAEFVLEAARDEADKTNAAVDIVAAYVRPPASNREPDALELLKDAGVLGLLGDMAEPGTSFEVPDRCWQGALIDALILDPYSTARTSVFSTGFPVVSSIGRYPASLLMYSAGLGALARGDYAALKAVLTIEFREQSHTRIGYRHLTSWAFNQAGVTGPNPERKYTPSSEFYLELLLPMMESVVTDPTSLFDQLEVLIALAGLDASDDLANERSLPWGCYAWRGRSRDAIPALAFVEHAKNAGVNWPPLTAGWFGGSARRFQEVADAFARIMAAAAPHFF